MLHSCDQPRPSPASTQGMTNATTPHTASIVKLAQIVRIEADVSLKEPKPKTIEEVLQRVEHETGVEGRRAFEGFLKKMHKTKEEQGG